MKAFCVILLSAFLSAVVSNPVGSSNDTAIASSPVGNSNDTAIAEKGNGLMNGVIEDLKGLAGNILRAMQNLPADYTHSKITTKDVNGTLIQTNTTIIKETQNNHVQFEYSRRNKILNDANSTIVTTN